MNQQGGAGGGMGAGVSAMGGAVSQYWKKNIAGMGLRSIHPRTILTSSQTAFGSEYLSISLRR